jgi:crotonobetainyl-CoA:carnitine CoA-transferase CaiB-like acyl-CoA transferase
MTPERRPFATTDGYVCALPYSDRHWRDLFEYCGRQDLSNDKRFAGINARTENIGALYAILGEILVTRSTAEWLEILNGLEIPCAPVTSLEALVDDPHLAATGFFTRIEQSDGAAIRLPGVPILFDGVRLPVRRPPRLGEHTLEVLGPEPVGKGRSTS